MEAKKVFYASKKSCAFFNATTNYADSASNLNMYKKKCKNHFGSNNCEIVFWNVERVYQNSLKFFSEPKNTLKNVIRHQSDPVGLGKQKKY